ncbi:MAG TPA: translation elongation factor Ts, partial [Candidatus Limnocylindrales bacterium]|nr:translation elongation factor Ts [Candidatus Limnocylindrales bacterium]
PDPARAGEEDGRPEGRGVMAIGAADVQRLRSETGAGVMDCKRALEETGGDLEKAKALLRERGLAKAATRAEREAKEGMVEAYIHAGGRIGALVELSSETDFVARSAEFRELARAIAMQVAAMSPKYVSETEIAAEDRDARPEEVVLLRQQYIRDPSKTIGDLVGDLAATTGENVHVRRFARFALGE